MRFWVFDILGPVIATPFLFGFGWALNRMVARWHSSAGESMRWRKWLIILLWGALMAVLSGSLFSAPNTGVVIARVLRTLTLVVPSDRLNDINDALRRTAHVSEYGVLFFVLRFAVVSDSRVALALCAIAAALDEGHQYLLPTRTGLLSDVLLDITGAVIAATILLYLDSRGRRAARVAAIPNRT